MTNTIDWLVETAKFMAKDRPDVYSEVSEAVEELSGVIERLRDINIGPVSSMMFTSYVMTRIADDGVEEFLLSRKLSTLCIFEDEEVVTVLSYDAGINLPDVMEVDDDDEYET